jgi:hypothetical protein
MSGVIPPLPNTPPWRGAELKHRDNFTFYLFMSILAVGRTPWTGDQPGAMPLPTQDDTTQKNADTHPCL